MWPFKKNNLWKDHRPDEYVFIGYYDREMTRERSRLYPENENQYFAFQDDIAEECLYWKCCLKESLQPNK
jgi:hypothetical protein